ncbi:MAG TPA: hypothetical protein VKY22_24940 [Bradyrhizobium sp.]|nr:hypothetical protein [Bradyrhizobium sp.]
MLTRAVGAIALTFCLSSTALAGHHPGIVQRVSCTVVRYYVAKYSASAAEMWARSHGATEAEIETARRCLNDAPAQNQNLEAARWFGQ